MRNGTEKMSTKVDRLKDSKSGRTSLGNDNSFDAKEDAKHRRKLEEINKIMEQKTEILLAKNLPYLEYMEVKEEIERIKEFKSFLERKIGDSNSTKHSQSI